jgi:hypothetical protein
MQINFVRSSPDMFSSNTMLIAVIGYGGCVPANPFFPAMWGLRCSFDCGRIMAVTGRELKAAGDHGHQRATSKMASMTSSMAVPRLFWSIHHAAAAMRSMSPALSKSPGQS